MPILVAVLLLSAGCQSKTDDSAIEQGQTASDDGAMRPDAAVPAGGNGNVPSGWSVRPDQGSATVAADTTGDIFFVNMTPGWHVTTGPAAIYYNNASTAQGSYSASLGVYLFDPKGRREAFGLLFGGTDLDGDDQSYSYFLIRQGGQYLVKTRSGDETQTVIDWTSDEAINSWSPDSGSTAFNTIALSVSPDSVSFFANDKKLASVAAGTIPTDGIVGFRINHGLNLHISDFTVDSD